MGPVAVVDVIAKVVMIKAIPSSGGDAPGGGRKGEASTIMGGRLVGGLDGIGIRVVADALCESNVTDVHRYHYVRVGVGCWFG